MCAPFFAHCDPTATATDYAENVARKMCTSPNNDHITSCRQPIIIERKFHSLAQSILYITISMRLCSLFTNVSNDFDWQ